MKTANEGLLKIELHYISFVTTGFSIIKEKYHIDILS